MFLVNICRLSILTQNTYLVQISSDYSLVSIFDTRPERYKITEIVTFIKKPDKGDTQKTCIGMLKKTLLIFNLIFAIIFIQIGLRIKKKKLSKIILYTNI